MSQVLSSGRSRMVSLGEEGAAGLERMEMEEVGFGGDLQGCRIVESVWEPKFCGWQSA